MEDAPWYLPVYGIWFWSIPAIFLFTVILLAVPLIYTFRREQAHVQSWKAFWNTMELIWIIGGSTSVIAMISQSWGILSEPLGQYMLDAVRDQYAVVQKASKTTFSKYCPNQSASVKDFCETLEQIILLPEPTLQNILTNNASVTSKQYCQSYKKASENNDEINRDAYWIGWELRDYNIFAGGLRYEIKSGVFSLPRWTDWIRAFAPHLFAFVFAIKIMRSIAVFAL